MIENITERKEAEQKLAYLAFHDELTGLPNRHGFEEVLEVCHRASASRSGPRSGSSSWTSTTSSS